MARAGAEVIAAGRSLARPRPSTSSPPTGLKARAARTSPSTTRRRRRTRLADARPPRHPRQQRRHHPPRRRRRLHRGRLGRGDRRQPQGRLLPLPGLRPRRLRPAGRRRHRQHRLAPLLPGRHPHPLLHRLQARRRRPDQAPRQRVGGARHQRQRHRARATSRPTTPRPCAPTPTARRRSSTASPPAAGASPSDIAGAAVFLASPAANYIHGTILPVDGGWLAR